MNKSMRLMVLALCATGLVVMQGRASEKSTRLDDLEAQLLPESTRGGDRGLESGDQNLVSVVVDSGAGSSEASSSSAKTSPAKSEDGLLSGEKKSRWQALKERCRLCWLWTPRGVKDVIEISGLTSISVGAAFTDNDPLAALVTGAATEQVADITSRHKYYVKLIAELGLFGGYKLLTTYTGFNIWTITLGLVLIVVDTTLNDYAIATGRKNSFVRDFSNIPVEVQPLFIKKLKILARQMRAIKDGRHAMPVESTEMDSIPEIVTEIFRDVPAERRPELIEQLRAMARGLKAESHSVVSIRLT